MSLAGLQELSNICKTYDAARLKERQEFYADVHGIKLALEEITRMLKKTQGKEIVE